MQENKTMRAIKNLNQTLTPLVMLALLIALVAVPGLFQGGADEEITLGVTHFSGLAITGGELVLDADDDSSITSDTDDQFDFRLGGADEYIFTAGIFDLGANTQARIDFDDDNDTSIRSSADDILDIELAGADVFQLKGANAAAASSDLLDMTSSTGIMDGSDTWIGLDMNLTGANHTGSSNVIVGIDLDLTTPDADATETALAINDTDWDIGIESALNIENLGLPTVASVAVTYTTSGAIFTITDGEIWFVHRVILNVTTDFDCTGSDCTVDIGDGDDVDGLLNLDDAMVQAAATDYTGGEAGWQGLDGAAPAGAYMVGGPHVYAPSGSDETIDMAVGGNTPAAGVGVVYIVYTRIQ